ncbi:sensor histidine kinase [Paenibacillus sp. p3-SID1389]|uniref:sensor histidine kinase n=1 Tax=Paenibacillus sp. p3-SID1389 TaxID=2916364 RepID=UPI0037CBCE0D
METTKLRSLASTIYRMLTRLQQLIDRLPKEQQRKEEARFQALQAQINPHFLFNTLNSIKWMAALSLERLISLGIHEQKAWEYANTRKGYWRISNSPILSKSLGNNRLKNLGFLFFSDYYGGVGGRLPN